MRYQDEQTRDEHPETVRSNPVPVAATSPESRRDDRTDGLPEETVDDRGSYDRDADGRPEGSYDADGVRRGDDEVTFHEPAPSPTAFGATSVGEDVAASALANPRNDVQTDPNDDSTVAVGDGRRDGDTDAVRTDDTGAMHTDDTAVVRDDDSAAVRADDDHRHGDPAADDLGTDDFTAAHSGSDELPARSVAESPVATMPQNTAEGSHRTDGDHGDGLSLLAAGTGAHLKERWRDVQLRFVDDPKGAAGEAKELVESAIDEIAASLKRSREELGDWQGDSADDTEKLRVAVRRYRDFLDRLVAL